MEHAMEFFKDAKRIVVFTGAGVSRNPPANLLTYAEMGFSFAREDIDPARGPHPAWEQFLQRVAEAEPTATHRFCAQLHAEGRLVRVYTQNVDGLHQRVLPADKVVGVHGTVPDIVCMDENPFEHNPRLATQLAADFDNENPDTRPDLCLVLGTRLQVTPFAWFPNMLSAKHGRRFFVNTDVSCVRPQVTSPYASGFGGSSAGDGLGTKARVGDRDVSTTVDWWSRASKFYRRQWLVEMDCDAFCEALITSDMPELEFSDGECHWGTGGR